MTGKGSGALMANSRTGSTRATNWGLVAGVLLLLSAFGNGSWGAGLAGVGVLIVVGRILYRRKIESDKLLKPWPWPADLRSLAEGLARPIDPTPKRLLPPPEKAALVAKVATTQEAIDRLTADKPAAWPLAVFASVLVQRRNAVQARLRTLASGYQPRPGAPPLSGQTYSTVAHGAMTTIVDLLGQIEQFMLSPAFKGAFGEAGFAGSVGPDADADADAIVSVANRLMDYHEALLVQAEKCVQTPVEQEALAFVQDAGALSLLPLLGYEKFIATMCARIGEAQDLLPYGEGGTVIQLDDVILAITMPDDLSGRFFGHFKQFQT